MDYFLSLTYSLLFFVSLISLFFTLNRRRANSDLPNLPPGSFGWPVIGETLEFLSGDPESFVRKRLEKHSAAVFKTNILGENAVVFSGADANKFVAANEQKLVRVWLPHSQQRLFAVAKSASAAKASPALARAYGLLRPDPSSVEKFDSVAKRHLGEYCRGGSEVIGAYDVVKSYALALSAGFLLGAAPERAVATMTRRFDDVVNGIQSLHVALPGTAFYRAKKAAAAVRREIEELAEEKRAAATATEGEDMLSVLVAGYGGGKVILTSAVANIAMGVMAASYGSVVTTIAFMVKFVGERRDIYDKIYSEQYEILASKGSDGLSWDDMKRMKYTWAVACETMRIMPPFLGTFREALTDFNYAGFTIPKGWKIFWAVNMTTKNPDYFPDPEKFDPSRFMENEHLPYTFLPFGGGPRMCAGKEYARLAILAFMHNLVTKFKWDVLFPDEKVLGGMVMPTPVKGLPIRLHPLPIEHFNEEYVP